MVYKIDKKTNQSTKLKNTTKGVDLLYHIIQIWMANNEWINDHLIPYRYLNGHHHFLKSVLYVISQLNSLEKSMAVRYKPSLIFFDKVISITCHFQFAVQDRYI